MGKQAEIFLSSYNRIEKELKRQLDNPSNMGFSEMVRRLARKRDSIVEPHENDLLQLAQLRNAIVHDQIADDFVIAEPNQWAVDRMLLIEQKLTNPEKVLPRFGKKVTGFEQSLPLRELLKIVAEKRYSQFPIYQKGVFQGLATLRTIGLFLAESALKGPVEIEQLTIQEVLAVTPKRTNFEFVAGDTSVAEVEKLFQRENLLEAIFITKDGDPNGNLLGIIRPRDIFNQKEDV